MTHDRSRIQCSAFAGLNGSAKPLIQQIERCMNQDHNQRIAKVGFAKSLHEQRANQNVIAGIVRLHGIKLRTNPA